MSKEIKLFMPMDGEVIPLSEVNDYLFNKKIMGEGVAVKPIGNYVYSPVDGEVILVYESKHAIGFKTEEGLQILLHIGIDSVKLEGRGFATYIKVGDHIKAGDKILFFDKDYLEEKASSVTPMVITNPELIESIDINYKAGKKGDILLSIVIK